MSRVPAMTEDSPGRRGAIGKMVLVCDWICRIAMLLMIVIVAAEVFARSVLSVSLQLSDELGGYLLVAISFLSLPVCQAAGGFHQVNFVHARLPRRGRAMLTLVMESLSFGFLIVLLWQLSRLEINGWQRGDVSDTLLAMPLWIPRLPMLLGTAALAVTLADAMASAWRALHHGGPA